MSVSSTSPQPNTPVEAKDEICSLQRPCGEKQSSIRAEKGSPSRYWKPLTLKAPILLSIVGFTCLLIACIEYLSWRSDQDQGVCFTGDKFSAAASFSYIYFPVVVAVFYSMVWSWIDLDTKRLEPYFQMSQGNGATAEDSLFLHYPFEFVAFAPIRALRRRHWSVVCGGFATAAVLWIVIPLTGSIFAQPVVILNIPSPVLTMSALAPLDQQTTSLDIGLLSTAYANLWLGQSLPSFTTVNNTLLPFTLRNDSNIRGSNETWTANTTMYSTSLTCNPANVTKFSTEDDDFQFIFSDGKGCVTFPIELDSPVGNWTALYIGPYDDPTVDYSLPVFGCYNSEHTFLAVWAGANATSTRNLTAIFCETSYHMQTANTTVSLPNMAISSLNPLGTATLLSAGDFNTSHFEYIIGSGIGPSPPRADIPQTDIVDAWPRIQNMSIIIPTTNMVSFAIGSSHLQPVEYLDASTLAASFEKAHKLLFALAARQVMSGSANPSRDMGLMRLNSQAFTVVRPLAITVEIALGLVAILAILLYLISRFRPSQLRTDPASLTQVMELMRARSSEDMLCRDADPLQCSDNRVRITDGIIVTLSKAPDGEEQVATSPSEADHGLHPTIRPTEMKTIIGITFVSILGLALGVTIALRIMIEHSNGLPLPTKNAIVNQIVLNYVPIVFATFLEPFWVLLNRWLCMLRPFEALRDGEGKPSRSIDLKYTSLPPQLIFWRALRAKHYLLVAVCLISLSGNLLAVALNGLFDTNAVVVRIKQGFPMQKLPSFVQGIPVSSDDLHPASLNHYYIAKTNITDGTPFPAWIDSEAFYLPLELTGTELSANAESFTTSTLALGASVQCFELNNPGSNMKAFFNSTSALAGGLATDPPVIVQMQHRDGTSFNCSINGETALESVPDGSLTGVYAGEIISTLNASSPTATGEDIEICMSTMLVAFLRAEIIIGQNTTDDTTFLTAYDSLSGLYIVCQPTMQVGKANITVDRSGRILNSTRQMTNSNTTALFTNATNAAAVYGSVSNLIASGVSVGAGRNPSWHDDLFAGHWFTYLIKASTDSSAFLDASLPLPSATNIIPVVEGLYTELFAIILGINPDMFAAASAGSSTEGSITVTQTRVFMVQSMYIITVVLLSLNIIVAAAYYVKRPKKMLGVMPTTIASVMKLFEGSGLVGEIAPEEERQQWKLGYGRFRGVDGKPHLGIEKRPFVQPWGKG